MEELEVKEGLCTNMDSDIFSFVRPLERDEREKFKDEINKEITLVPDSDRECLESYLISFHVKRLISIDYELFVRVSGEIKPEKIDEYFKEYGIEDETLLVVLTFCKPSKFKEYDT